VEKLPNSPLPAVFANVFGHGVADRRLSVCSKTTRDLPVMGLAFLSQYQPWRHVFFE
jgi:hypothetical protein